MADKGDSVVKIDATGIYYRVLNARLRDIVKNGTQKIELHNVNGQRYIGTDLDRLVDIEIFGTPGNDLGAFMDGPRIIVRGNAQDGCGNTMNSGEIIVHGHAGDIVGLSARGGRIFISVPNEDNSMLEPLNLSHVHFTDKTHRREYSQEKFKCLLDSTGFNVLALLPHFNTAIAGVPLLLAKNNPVSKVLAKLCSYQMRVLMKVGMLKSQVIADWFVVGEKDSI